MATQQNKANLQELVNRMVDLIQNDSLINTLSQDQTTKQFISSRVQELIETQVSDFQENKELQQLRLNNKYLQEKVNDFQRSNTKLEEKENEIIDLKKKYFVLQDQMDQQVDLVRQGEIEKEVLKKRCKAISDAKDQILKDQNDQKEITKRTTQEWQTKEENLQEQIHDLQKQIKKIKQLNSVNLQEINDTFLQQTQSFQNEIEKYQRDIFNLESEIQQIQSHLNKKDEIIQKINESNAKKLQELKNENKLNLIAKQQELEETMKEMQQIIDEKQISNQDHQQQIQLDQIQFKKYDQKIQEFEKTIIQFEHKMEEKKRDVSDLDKQLQQKEKENHDLKLFLEIESHKNLQQSTQLNQIKEQHDKLNNHFNQLQNQYDQVNEQYQETINMKIPALSFDLAEKQIIIDKHKQEIERKIKSISDLENIHSIQKEDIHKTNLFSESIQKANLKMRQQNQALEKEIKEINQNMMEKIKIEGENSQKNLKEILEIKSQLEISQQLNKSLQNEILMIKQSNMKFDGDLTLSKNKYSELVKEKNQQGQYIEKLTNQLQESKNKLLQVCIKSKSQIQQLYKQKNEIKKTLGEVKEQYTEQKNLMMKFFKDLDYSLIDQIRKLIVSMEHKVHVVKSHNQSQQNQIENFQINIENLNDVIANLNSQRELDRQSRLDLVKDKEKALIQVNEDIVKLQMEIQLCSDEKNQFELLIQQLKIENKQALDMQRNKLKKDQKMLVKDYDQKLIQLEDKNDALEIKIKFLQEKLNYHQKLDEKLDNKQNENLDPIQQRQSKKETGNIQKMVQFHKNQISLMNKQIQSQLYQDTELIENTNIYNKTQKYKENY